MDLKSLSWTSASADMITGCIWDGCVIIQEIGVGDASTGGLLIACRPRLVTQDVLRGELNLGLRVSRVLMPEAFTPNDHYSEQSG